VKQPQDTEAQASLSSDEQPTSPAPEAPAEPAARAETSREAAAEEQATVIAQTARQEVASPSAEEGAESATEHVQEATGIPDADVPADDAQPEPGAAAEPSPYGEAQPAPDAGAEPAPDAEPRPEPDAGAEPALAADPAPDAEAQPEPDAEAPAAPEAETEEEDSPIAQHDGATTPTDEDDSPIAREIADLTARRKALDAAEVQLTGRTRVLTVSNQKGGVGKTTTTVNLAAALAERGARVLVIDLDPQGNASTALGVPHTSDIPSVYDVLIDEFPLADIIQVSPESPNLLCAPSTIHLAGAEIELVSQVAREHRLRVAVDDYLASHEGQIDFILIDCPPSLGLLTINAFTAATELLIPIQCEYYALEGLSQLLGTVRMIQKHLNPRLQLSTIMLTMYDGRTRLAQQVADEVREHFPNEVLETIIPRSVRVSEAPSFGQSVLAYDGQSAGAIAYREAAVEMIRRDSASNERGI
jgi:chromosome partitioning protein